MTGGEVLHLLGLQIPHLQNGSSNASVSAGLWDAVLWDAVGYGESPRLEFAPVFIWY